MRQMLRDWQGVKSEVYLPSLSWAALFGLEDIVEVLLAAGADPELIHEGFTPLHQAVKKGQAEVVRVLIAHGVDLEKGDQKYGLSPLHWSLLVGSVDVMDLLLEAGANQTAIVNLGRKVFDFMGIWSHIAIGRDEAADVNAQPEDPFTMFIVAASNGRGKVVKFLLDAQADVNAQREDGSTALIVAARNGHGEVVNMLLEVKADVNVQNNNGFSALIGAAENGHVEVVKLLLDAHADVALQSKSGWTTFHAAVGNRHLEVVKLLLPAYVEVTVPDTTALPSSGHPAFADRLGLLHFLLDLYPSDHLFHEFLGNWHLASASPSLASKSYDLCCILNPMNAHILQVNDIIHTHFCDHCDVRPIRGIMQKCITCDDYDLCQKCSTMTPHPHADHEFIQIPSDECVARLGNRP